MRRFDLGPVLPASEVQTIEREELRRTLASGCSLRLVMCLPEWEFLAKRIPGSIRFDTPDEMLASFRAADEIVVYCTNADCLASQAAYRRLVEHGFSNVRRYVGGLSDWEEAGLPLEGTRAS